MPTHIEYDDTYENGVLVERIEVVREDPIDRRSMVVALEDAISSAANVQQLRDALRTHLAPLLRDVAERG